MSARSVFWKRLGWGWVAWASPYVAAVTVAAAVGERSASAGPLLAAVALTLQCGIAALFGVYGIFAVLVIGSHIVGVTPFTAAGDRRYWFIAPRQVRLCDSTHHRRVAQPACCATDGNAGRAALPALPFGRSLHDRRRHM